MDYFNKTEMTSEVEYTTLHYTTDVQDAYISNLNLTEIYLLNNVTIEAIPRWHKILDGVTGGIMVVNTVALMMGMGAATYWKDVVGNLWPPIGILIGMFGQFLILPFLGFCLSIIFGFKPYEALGVLIVSCSPGGSFSNFLAYWMDGDIALSIVMTTCSSIIAFGGMPLNLWIYSQYWVNNEETEIQIPFLSIVTSLFFISVPVGIGMVIRHFSEAKAKLLTKITSLMGFIGMGAVILLWLFLYWETFLRATSTLYTGAIILPISGFTLAYFSGKLFCRTNRQCRTIGIETGSQNMPVALSIITLSFSDPQIRQELILFPTLYGTLLLIEMFLLIGLYQAWKRKFGKKKEGSELFPMEHTATIEKGTIKEQEPLNA